MSTNHSATSAAPTTLTFADGTEYKLSALRDVDIDELSEWVQSRILKTALRCIDESWSQARKDSYTALAMKTATAESWNTPVGVKLLMTVDGLVQVLAISIRKHHPNIDINMLKKQLRDPDNLKLFNTMFKKMNRNDKEPSKNPQEGQ